MIIQRNIKSKLDAILICDSLSQTKIKTSLTELATNGLKILYSLDDIPNNVNEDNTVNVILLSDIVRFPRILNRLELYKEAFNINYIYLSADDYSLEYMCNYAECYKIDISILDYPIVHSVLMKDMSTINKRVYKGSRESSVETFAKEVISSPEVDQDARDLASDYLNQIEINKAQARIIAKLKDRVTIAEENENSQKLAIKQIQSNYLELINNSRLVNSSIRQYEVLLSEDIYSKIPVSKYDNAPVILYFKVYEDLIHFNSFLDTLFNVIRVQLKSSVKILQLYGSSASKIAPVFPNKYKIVKDKYLSSEITNNDFLIKYGNYEKLLSFLFTNALNLKFLIIVDKKEHNDMVTIGANLEYSVCRNFNDISGLNLNKFNTIVNNEEGNPLSWDTYSSYNTFDSEDDQFSFLSGRPVIRKLVLDIKKVTNV